MGKGLAPNVITLPTTVWKSVKLEMELQKCKQTTPAAMGLGSRHEQLGFTYLNPQARGKPMMAQWMGWDMKYECRSRLGLKQARTYEVRFC
jgi:hypothetical protein